MTLLAGALVIVYIITRMTKCCSAMWKRPRRAGRSPAAARAEGNNNTDTGV